MCVHVCHVCVSALGSQKRVLPGARVTGLELELQAVISLQMLVLGSELRFSGYLSRLGFSCLHQQSCSLVYFKSKGLSWEWVALNSSVHTGSSGGDNDIRSPAGLICLVAFTPFGKSIYFLSHEHEVTCCVVFFPFFCSCPPYYWCYPGVGHESSQGVRG